MTSPPGRVQSIVISMSGFLSVNSPELGLGLGLGLGFGLGLNGKLIRAN